MTNVEEEVWKQVDALNCCWIEGNAAKLKDYFHRDMVAITPADRLPLVGGQLCLASWNGFAKAVAVHSWKTSEPRVKLFGDCAVVTYLYELECDLNGRHQRLAGRDMMCLIRDSGRWWVVADQFSPYPAL